MKRKTDNFSKFINRKSPGAVKEEIRQERKLIKKERKEGIEKHFEEKRNKRALAISQNKGVQPDADSHSKELHLKSAEKSGHTQKPAEPPAGATLPLNKFIAHAGVSSRR